MKRLIPLFSFLFIQLSLMLTAQNTNDTKVIRGERPPIDLNALTEDAYEQGTVLIKFGENSGKQLEGMVIKNDEEGNIRFGFENVDALCKQFSVGNAEQLFSSIASKNGFTAKHKAWGFDRWYKLKTDDQTDIIALVQAFQKLEEIETAEPEYKKVPVWKTGAVIQHPDQDKTIPNSKWTPNDPLFDQQWHYFNTGQNGGQPGADIDLLNAWDIEKGNPNVIVAVIDDGIDFNHPDLAANMWSGIGYNFVDNMATVIPGFHGTHVAGTVAAVSNNNIGVAGIAGGSGSGDGIRLMSCQVFRELGGGQYLSGGFEDALIYAADQGAAIAQNSWAYVQAYAYNLAVLDAIDYFVLNGGGNAITDGGLVIFAAGNSNSSAPTYPAAYAEVIGVASTDRMDIKSSFSNYGHWVSISAPGSDILSTGMNNSYTYASGTSMACPHVSGVAALVASKGYGQLHRNEIKEILLYTTDNHYDINPGFLGKLGSGRLNAYNALLETNATLNNNANPASFKASSIDPNTIMLAWDNNNNNDEIIIAWDLQSIEGQPINGVNYAAGQVLPGGGSVLFTGHATQFEHTGLVVSTKYHYKIWAKNNLAEYSSGRNTEEITHTCFPVNQCNYTFRLTSLGNGSWADSYMTVEQGNRVITELYKFCGTAFHDVEVSLCENTLFQLIWHPGTWGDLMGIEIIGPYGNSIFKRPAQSAFPTNHPILFEGETDCNEPSCYAPENILVFDHQTTEVTVQWTTPNSQSLVNLEYGLLGFETGSGTVISNISESPYTLTGLSSGTRYEVRLQSNCGDNDLSFWSLPVYFETSCGFYDVPFFEDFSNVPYRELPMCWERYGSNGNWAAWGNDRLTLHHWPNVYVNAVSPILNQPINQLRMYYDLTWDNYRANLQLGTHFNENNTQTFTALESIPSRLMYDFEPAEKRVIYFESYTGTDQQIAFQLGAADASNGSWAFIDNIVIESVPSCPEPYRLNIEDITETTAQLNWAQAGTVQQWEIKLGEIGFDPDTEGFLISGIAGNPFIINNLIPATFYQVYIRSNCGIEQSIWSQPIVFSSAPGELSLPHIENFNDCPVTHLPPGWLILGEGMYNAVVLDGWGTNQSHGILLKNSYFESTSMLVAPDFSEPVENIVLRFAAMSNRNLSFDVGILSNDLDIESFQNIESLQIPEDVIYRNYFVDFDVTSITSGKIAIKIQGGPNDFNTLWLDDFEFLSANGCIQPENLHVEEITSESASIKWDQLGNIDTWDLNYGVHSFNPDEEGTIIPSIQTTNYILTGLEQLGNYAIYVRAHCAEGSFSDWVGPVIVNTPCSTITPPYFEDFESTPTNTSPSCWAINSMSVKVLEDQAYAGQKSLRLQIAPNNNGFFISPEINAPMNNLKVEFRGLPFYQQTSNSIQIGTVASQIDVDSFEKIAEFDFLNLPGQPWQDFGITLNNYSGAHQHLAFLIENTTNQWIEIFIDDLSIETLPLCPVPFELSSITTGLTSAQLSWQYEGNTPYWDVVYGPSGFDPTTQGTQIEQIEANQLILYNLNHSTFYEFYVRGYCDGTAGEWSSPGLFRTDCGAHELTILSPLENQLIVINQNSTLNLAFDYVGCYSGNITIQILNSDYNPICAFYDYQLNGSASYLLAIPLSDAFCSGTFSLKISFWENQNNSIIEYYSDSFQIENTTISLEINSPQQNNNFLAGRTLPISWNSSTDQAVDLFYSLDDGSNWETIATVVNSQCGYQQWGYNHYQWNVPTSISGTYSNARIKTALANDPSVYATSEVFTITSVYPIVFNSPQQGDIFLQGEDIVLDFDVVGDSWIDIRMFLADGSSQNLDQYFASEGNQTYTINNNNLPVGYGYRFEIFHSAFGASFMGAYYAVVDQYPDCVTPMHMEVNNISPNSADISWVSYSQAISWNIEWGLQYFEPGNGNLIEDIAQPFYTLQGLPQGQNIFFYITAECGNGVWSEPSQLFQFTTECGQWEIPHLEDFESYTLNSFPNCWSGTGAGKQIVNDQYFSADQSLRIQAEPFGSSMLTSPAINADLQSLQLKFKALPDNEPALKTIQIGSLNAAADPNSFHVLTTFELLNIQGQPWQEFNLPLYNAIATHKHIAFRLVNNQDNWISVYLDDVALELLPDCPVPFNLTAANITQNSANLSWEDHGNQISWDVLYGKKGFDPQSEGTLVEQLQLPETAIQGLNHSTFYEFYVRGYCDGTAGEWSSPGLFRTDCGENSFTILAPTAQDVFDVAQNNTINIQVDFEGCMANYVNVALQDVEGNFLQYFYYGIHFVGSDSYTIPTEIPLSICPGSYRLMVYYQNYETNTQMEYFTEYFSIENSAEILTVRYPYLNQNLLTGRSYGISWNSSTDQAVDLFYSLDDGNSWNLIVSNLNNQCGYNSGGHNNYQWNVPTSISGTYSNARIKTALAKDPSVYATSEVFTITSVYPIVFNSPQQGDIFLQGDDIVLDFDVVGDSWINIYVQDQIGNNQHLGQFYVNEGNNVKTFNSQQMSLGYGHTFNIQHQSFGDWFTSPFFAILEELPDCNKPNNFVATNIGYIDADLEWQSAGNESSWNICYGYQGFTPSESNQIEQVSMNSIHISNLQPNSIYDFYVQAICDDNNQSAWEGPLRIQTKALPEGWNISLNLPFEMQLIAQLQINQIISSNPDDILGAFIGNMCVGIGNPNTNGLIQMKIYSYNSAFDPVQFKIWDSQLQQSCDAGPGFIFEDQTIVGNESNPWIIRCMEYTTQNLTFGQGYTWFSLNVNPGNMSLNHLFSGLSPCYDDRVIGQTTFALFTGNSWLGSLSALEHDKMYRMKLCSEQQLSLTGEASALTPINLAAGYTWLGYQPQQCQSVATAMAGLNPGPSYDDRVIGQNSFALFTGSQWLGSLTQMCPGAGYVIKLANAQTLTYPATSAKSSSVEQEVMELISPTGVYPPVNYQHSMMVVAKLQLPDGVISLNEKDVVYASINGEVRGMANPMPDANGTIFLSIAENEDLSQPISFMVWLDEQQELLPLNEILSFEPLAAVGNLDNPFIFTMGEMVGMVETDGVWIGEPYPNPFSEQTTVPYFLNEAAEMKFRLYDSRGVQVKPAQSIAADKGHHLISIESVGLARGVYVLEVQISNRKLIQNKIMRLIVY